MTVALRRFALAACLSLAAVWLAAAPVQAQTQNDGSHVVQAGDNLFRIGLRYGVSVDALMRANGLTSIYIYVGQRLVIPGTAQANPAPPPAAAPTPDGSALVHVVQPGETLFKIGLRYNLPWTKIQAANQLTGDRVYAGQRLVIPASSQSAPAEPPTPEAAPAPTEAAPTPAPAEGTRVHVVQAGETLFSIGLRYNLQWTAILAANNLASDRIYTGQQLTIPAPGSAAGLPADPPPGQGPVPGLSGRYFLVDLSEQRLYAFEGDQLVRTTLVSTGLWPYPTVTGTYAIYARYTSTRMIGPGYDLPNVPYTQYFYRGYGLHGTYWHNNFGTPMSHGCVNMPTPEAEWAFNWAGIGTPVVVQQ